MSKWITSNLNENEWDKLVFDLKGNYRQFYSWGDYKKETGWEVIRYIRIENDNKITALAQLLIKGIWPVYFIYIPGGIVDGESGLPNDISILIKSVKKFTFKYVRIDSNYKKSFKNHTKLNFQQPSYNINSSESLIFNLQDPNFINKATLKWKYNLRRAYKNDILIFSDEKPDYEEIKKIYNEMKIRKTHYREDDPKNFFLLSKYFKHKIIFKKCINNDKLVGFRCALVINNIAWDYFGAINEMGRRLKVGYPILNELLNECKKNGVKYYNLGGIELIKNPGVSKFKIDTGAKKILYEGEFEYSNVFLLKKVINLLLEFLIRFKIKKLF